MAALIVDGIDGVAVLGDEDLCAAQFDDGFATLRKKKVYKRSRWIWGVAGTPRVLQYERGVCGGVGAAGGGGCRSRGVEAPRVPSVGCPTLAAPDPSNSFLSLHPSPSLTLASRSAVDTAGVHAATGPTVRRGVARARNRSTRRRPSGCPSSRSACVCSTRSGGRCQRT